MMFFDVSANGMSTPGLKTVSKIRSKKKVKNQVKKYIITD
jgi:hypothetical protein